MVSCELPLMVTSVTYVSSVCQTVETRGDMAPTIVNMNPLLHSLEGHPISSYGFLAQFLTICSIFSFWAIVPPVIPLGVLFFPSARAGYLLKT